MEAGDNAGGINMSKDPRLARLQKLRMRTESMEQVKRRQEVALMTGADETGPQGDLPNQAQAEPVDEGVAVRNQLLLRAGFAAWKPDGKLSTTNFLKSSIARILMRSEEVKTKKDPESRNAIPDSAKVRGAVAPARYEAAPDTTIDAMDGYFKWYASTVVRVKANSALIKFGDWPDRFNEWIGFDSARMAGLGTFTNCEMTNRMSQGTTADVAIGTEVEVYHKSFRTWVPARVIASAEDGESLQVEGDDLGQDWVAINDGRVRLFKRKERAPVVAPPQNYTKFTPPGCDVEFEVWDRYEQPKFVGQGAYGCVIFAYDNFAKQHVAIKKVIDIQEMDNIDAMRTLREMKICRHMIGHENVVKLFEIIPPTTCDENINEVYMVFEWMAGDLSKFIRSGALQDTHVMGFTYQIIAALKYIHSAGIMHRDMKPSNILVNPKGDIKLADFGLAIGMTGQSHQLINYVVTRWYRAPELLLDQKNYGPAIDMWSTGCILGEMLARRPLFRGNSSKDQLRLILSLIGKPKPDDVEFVDKPRYKEMLLKMQEKAAIPWAKIFHKAQPDVLDLLDKLLQFSPDKRIDATDSLSHPYFASLHNPQYEPDCKELFGYVTEDLDVKEIFRLLAAESVIPVAPIEE